MNKAKVIQLLEEVLDYIWVRKDRSDKDEEFYWRTRAALKEIKGWE